MRLFCFLNQKLEFLNLRACNLVTDEAVNALAEHCPMLHTLHLLDCEVKEMLDQIALVVVFLTSCHVSGVSTSNQGPKAETAPY
jgi:hypothetical protein